MKWGRKDKPKRPTFITHSPKNVDYSKTPDFIKIADDFVEKFYNGDYAIDLNVFHVPNGDLDKEASLGHFLIVAIRDYIVAKSEKDLKRKEEFADDLLTWLTQAYGLGLIKEGEGMKTKIGRYEQQIQ